MCENKIIVQCNVIVTLIYSVNYSKIPDVLGHSGVNLMLFHSSTTSENMKH